MKETIERIIERISDKWSQSPLTPYGEQIIKEILTEELSTLNPMKIDEERFMAIYHSNKNNTLRRDIQEYNSTIQDHQVLQPLPSEMPLDFKKIDYKEDPSKVWKWLLSRYGTPTKKELVSVEEFIDDVNKTYVKNDYNLVSLAYYLYNTYSLNAPKREWWMDLKEGDKFMCNGKDWTFYKAITMNKIYFAENMCFDSTVCTPYTEPSIHDKVKEKLGIELYEEFMKEVKG